MKVEGRKQKHSAWVRPMAALLWLVIWQLAAMLLNMPVLLPSPITTIQTLFYLGQQAAFWQSIFDSLMRIAAGYLLAVVLGSILAIVCANSTWADAFFSPLRTLIRSTPITSFIILVLLWLRIDQVPVFISMLTVLPIVWQSVQQGIEQMDNQLLEMTNAYRFTWANRQRYLYVPSVMPYFYAACATAIGFAWKAGIAAEVIAKPPLSIGRNLQDAKVYLNTSELFAWTFAVVMMSLCLEKILKWLLMRNNRARRAEHAAG